MEKQKEYQREYYQKNMEMCKAKHKKYYVDNKAVISERRKIVYQADLDLAKIVNRLAYEANREVVIARSKARYWKLKQEKSIGVVSNQ